MDDLQVVGYTEYVYDDNDVTGHNCDFTYTPKKSNGHILLVEYNNEYYRLYFSETQGECPSGWCKATYGNIEIESTTIDDIDNIEYFSNSMLTIPYCALRKTDFKSDFISFSNCGDDYYYPDGYYSFESSFFTEKISLKEQIFLSIDIHKVLELLLDPDRLHNIVILCNNEINNNKDISIRDLVQTYILDI